MTDTAVTNVSAQENEPRTLPSAKAPIGPGPITIVGASLGVVTLGLGVIAIRDSLIAFNAIDGMSWLSGVGDWIDGFKPVAWMVPGGVAIAIVGLWMLGASLRPRPKNSVALNTNTGVNMAPRSIARIAVVAARDVDGVLGASAKSTTRRLVLTVKTTVKSNELSSRVKNAVETSLNGLNPAPRVSVRLKPQGTDL